jgi:anti-anti-sigma factor
MLPSSGRPEAATTLPVGAALLLYTDGLVERRDALLDEGLDRLAAVAEPCRALPLPALVDRVLHELGHHDGASDDIALVAVRILPAPLRMDLDADPHQLAPMRRQIHEWATGIGLGREKLDDLQLAVVEAAGNAVEHAYRDSDRPGQVQVVLSADPDGGVRVTVSDQGKWRPPPQDPGCRGRGVQIIKALADEVDIAAGSDGTVVRFRLPPASTSTPPTDAVDAGQATRESADQPAAIRVHDTAQAHWVEVGGVLDLAGVAAVRRTLLDELACDRPIVLDWRHVRWLASVGVGLLLEATRTARGHGEVDVRLPSDGPVRRLLDLTGLTQAVADDRRL